MNNFLAGVVRRGAGIPSPVTIRPAMAPPDVPVDAPSVPMTARYEETGSSFSSAPDATPGARPVSGPQEVRPKESLPKTNPQTAVALPELPVIEPQSITPARAEVRVPEASPDRKSVV